jgi:hypothetical protein
MWLITKFGFFSVVEKPSDQGEGSLTIRARSKKDLMNLKKNYLPEMSEIETSDNTDYKYRATAPRKYIAEAFMQAIQDIHYSNFLKNFSTSSTLTSCSLSSTLINLK